MVSPPPRLPSHWPATIRRIVLRYVLPVTAAVSLLALLGVPYLERLLAG